MTTHKIINGNSNKIKDLKNKSVHLIVTSPPYPMIEMWDNLFSEQNPSISKDLSKGDALNAFNKMHSILNSVWDECDRVLIDNGFICINIGDATRTINGNFQLFSNHTAIINYFISKGYSVLPDIIWHKQSNSPNKFMGSGMYPAGAYVTYEHEYILIFRKGGKRVFKGTEKELRQKSAFFWEERNVWFSDLWEIKGTSQIISASKSSRERSAAYPFEIPYRLVNMYSAEGDTVLDPFAGLGTTNLACMASKRNSIGVEIDKEIASLAIDTINVSTADLNKIIDARIKRHLEFIDGLPSDKRERCYKNRPHGFDVKTKQETAIKIDRIASITKDACTVTCIYE
jgi:DNA modification methylase